LKKESENRVERGLQTSLFPPRLTCLDRENRTLGAVKREIGRRLAHAGFLYSRIHGPVGLKSAHLLLWQVRRLILDSRMKKQQNVKKRIQIRSDEGANGFLPKTQNKQIRLSTRGEQEQYEIQELVSKFLKGV